MPIMIEVRIDSIRISLMSPNQVVILKELDGARSLPIFIGKPEGDAITFKLNQVEVPRPLSHDLAANILEHLGAKTSHILIREIQNHHYHASLFLQHEGNEIEIDCRSSDAIAVAVRAGCPIFVADDVMNEAGIIPDEGGSEEMGDVGDMSAFDDFLSSLDLGDLGKDK
jgi:hypothetical protein